MNISKLNHRSLSQQNAVSLQQREKSEQTKTMEQQMKDKLQHAPQQQVSSEAATSIPKLEVKVTGAAAHFQFVHELEGMSDDEKKHLYKAITTSLDVAQGGTDDYLQMSMSQSVKQLQLIADKLMPTSAQSQMQQAIQAYEQESLDNRIQLYAIGQKSLESIGIANSKLQNGTARVHEQIAWMTEAYNNLDFTNQSTFVQSFEAALQTLTDKRTQTDVWQQHVLKADEEGLRAQWNRFATVLNDPAIFKLPTAEQSIFDIQA